MKKSTMVDTPLKKNSIQLARNRLQKLKKLKSLKPLLQSKSTLTLYVHHVPTHFSGGAKG